MNENLKLLDGYAVTLEIYKENEEMWCYIVADRSQVRGTGKKYSVTCIADVSKALNQVLVGAVEYEMQNLKEE